MPCILFHSENRTPAARRFQDVVTRVASGTGVTPVESNGNLTGSMRTLGDRPSIVVLLTEDMAQLERAVAAREFLSGAKVVLVVHAMSPEIARLGHMLRPRYIACVGESDANVTAVLEKMLQARDPWSWSTDDANLNNPTPTDLPANAAHADRNKDNAEEKTQGTRRRTA